MTDDDAARRPTGPPSIRAKALPRKLPIIAEPPELVPARMINEVVYCERLMYLEWSQGEFAHNAFTVDGSAVHARADKPSGALPTLGTKAEEDDEAEEPPPYQARSVWLSSEELGMTAKIDVVEGDASGIAIPIEYKRSAAPDVAEGAFLPERVQVCAQVLLLRANGYSSEYGEIYFARSKRRVTIAIDQALIDTTMEAVRRVRELARGGELPPPLIDDSRCDGCSLVGICLPDETNLLGEGLAARAESRADPANAMEAFWPVAEDDVEGVEPEIILRRLQPARDDQLPLHVQEQGAKISLSGEELLVKSRDGTTTRARLPNISQVALYGNIQISTQAIRAIMERGIDLSFLTAAGWFCGRATGNATNNIELRMAQHRLLGDPDVCLRLTRGVVASKIRNCRVLLRRNHVAAPEVTLFELEQLAKKAERAESIASLLGFEGTAARSYYGEFSGMIKTIHAGDFDLEGRNRRPPRDPVNALLSFAYSLLTREVAQAITSSGLDPLLGFYHQPRFGRPALALDLMEEFRPILGDSTVISAINNGVLTASDFEIHPTGVSLKSHARKRYIQAFERRMDQLVTHPVFGYRVSYRRVLEVQCRLLGRFLLGEIPEYPDFRTR